MEDEINNNTSIGFFEKFYDWSLTGVDFSYDGNGGIECRDHVTFERRLNDTLIGMGVPSFAYLIYVICNRFSGTTKSEQNHEVSTYIPCMVMGWIYILKVSSTVESGFSKLFEKARCIVYHVIYAITPNFG